MHCLDIRINDTAESDVFRYCLFALSLALMRRIDACPLSSSVAFDMNYGRWNEQKMIISRPA
jgi:hypothetical protein